ncbi:MAG: hypothetical protein ACF8OB_00895, partial [Phycisphaeraceae bacterium JB051]
IKEDQMIQSNTIETPTPETTDDQPAVEDRIETEDQVEETEADPIDEEQVVDDPVDERTPEQIEADKEHHKLVDLQDWQKAVRKQAEICDKALQDWSSAKDVAASKKKRYDTEAEKLRKMALEEPEETLFNPRSDNGDVFGQNSDTAKPAPDTEEAWRDATLDDLGITGALADKLVDAELDTLGKISDYTSSGKQITDIKGIGPEKSEFISDACANYFAEHPVASNTPDDEQTTETDESETDDSDQPESGGVELSLVGVEDDDDSETDEDEQD